MRIGIRPGVGIDRYDIRAASELYEIVKEDIGTIGKDSEAGRQDSLP